MIVLDTNVISEMMKASPSINVIRWFDQQEAAELYISVITIAEISYGIQVLPESHRRQALEVAFAKTIKNAFKYRHLYFDHTAAEIYGKIMGVRKRLGKPLSILDGQIASIALANDASLATRNTRDFSDCDLVLINPF